MNEARDVARRPVAPPVGWRRPTLVVTVMAAPTLPSVKTCVSVSFAFHRKLTP